MVAEKAVLRALMVSRKDLEKASDILSYNPSCYGRRVGAIRSSLAYPDMLCTDSTSSHSQALWQSLAGYSPAVEVFRVWPWGACG
jgi:hypothetical protein